MLNSSLCIGLVLRIIGRYHPRPSFMGPRWLYPKPILPMYLTDHVPSSVQNAMMDLSAFTRSLLSKAIYVRDHANPSLSKTQLAHLSYSEMKVASLNRMPSSTVSWSPIFSFKVTFCFLGMYCRHLVSLNAVRAKTDQNRRLTW